MDGTIDIRSSDGVQHKARVRIAAREDAPVLLCLPAMGTEASYYGPLAERLAAEDVATTVLLDLRGQGLSTARARAGHEFGYREILELDLEKAIQVLRGVFPKRRLYIAGHSLGGQLGLLLAGRLPGALDGLVLVASGTAYYRDWPRAERWRANLVTTAIGLAGRSLPWYPGKLLGFGGDQPRRMMRDWVSVARKGVYRPEGSAFDYESAVRQVALPVLSIGVREDPVAPPSARGALLARAPGAQVSLAEIDGVRGHGPWRRHFSWAREPDEVIARIGSWLAARA